MEESFTDLLHNGDTHVSPAPLPSHSTLKVHFLLLFLLFVIFINYFLLLRGARGIVLLYLFIVQGEGVRLDFIFLISFTLERDGGTS